MRLGYRQTGKSTKKYMVKKEHIPLLSAGIKEFLINKVFINIATCDLKHNPNVAPKFILKIEDDCLYLGDYVINKTFKNIKNNPRVSLATVDLNKLVGYQMNGIARIVGKGTEYKELFKKMQDRQVELSTNRIIEGIRAERKHENFEVSLPERVVFFKVQINEIVKIKTSGKLEKKSKNQREAKNGKILKRKQNGKKSTGSFCR